METAIEKEWAGGQPARCCTLRSIPSTMWQVRFVSCYDYTLMDIKSLRKASNPFFTFFATKFIDKITSECPRKNWIIQVFYCIYSRYNLDKAIYKENH